MSQTRAAATREHPSGNAVDRKGTFDASFTRAVKLWSARTITCLCIFSYLHSQLYICTALPASSPLRCPENVSVTLQLEQSHTLFS